MWLFQCKEANGNLLKKIIIKGGKNLKHISPDLAAAHSGVLPRDSQLIQAETLALHLSEIN